ncbi:MAG: 4Fe-4S binding protein [Bacteroidales bacterium]|nr:4Fe-4S binding protein [Bacteroidales bacterium]
MFVLAFCDFKGSTNFVSLAKYQFVPAWLLLVSRSAAWFWLPFTAIALLTLLFGRLYCSVLCPLGILQDFMAKISYKLKLRKLYTFARPLNTVRYIFLALFILGIATALKPLLMALDPYSNFGRIAAHIIKPTVLHANNLLASVLELFNIYTVYKVVVSKPSVIGLASSVLLIFILALFAYKRGRLFCNTVCPVGTLLGLLSRRSALKIQIEAGTCTSCGSVLLTVKPNALTLVRKQ